MNYARCQFFLAKIFLLLFVVNITGCNLLVNQEHSEQPTDSAIASDACKFKQEDSFATAIKEGINAANLAQMAQSTEEWQLVADQWLRAIAHLQSVTLSSPKRRFAEKKQQEYLKYYIIAQKKANKASNLPFANFNSDFLNQQLVLYLSYIAAVGKPDVLIVGSSRAVQGINPKSLEKELLNAGKGQLRVFNLGINGATAQVVDVLLREILTPEQLPKTIIWADGLRAFNSGREDRTYQAIIASEGYQQLSNGNRPQMLPEAVIPPDTCESSQEVISQIVGLMIGQPAIAADVNNTDTNGFLPTTALFEPNTYYQKYPQVSGLYDSDYQNFNLEGEQTTAFKKILAYTQQQQIKLIFVNLPLTQDYLDDYRSQRETEFVTWMRQQSQPSNFTFLDFSQQWLKINLYFADPSHLNSYGASAIAPQLTSAIQ